MMMKNNSGSCDMKSDANQLNDDVFEQEINTSSEKQEPNQTVSGNAFQYFSSNCKLCLPLPYLWNGIDIEWLECFVWS